MVILLDEDVYDKIRKSNVSTDLSGRYVIAHRGTEYGSIELPIEDTENNMGLPYARASSVGEVSPPMFSPHVLPTSAIVHRVSSVPRRMAPDDTSWECSTKRR